MNVTVKGVPVFCGAALFRLKAERGFPLDFAIDRIMNAEGLAIGWAGFVDEARRCGWWDFQTVEAVEHALADAAVARDVARAIVLRVKAYVMQRPLK